MPSPNIQTFDFNLLRTLHVLLRERSVTRTAKELNVTQQAVSGSLKRIRQHFDDPILIRVGLRLEPTLLATALVTPVHDALRQIALTLDVTPALSPETTKRRFRIAMSDHASLILLPRMIEDVSRRFPAVTYDIVPVNRRAVYDIDLGDVDFLIMPLGHTDQLYLPQTICSAPLFEDRFVCVIDKANPLAIDELSIEDYASLRHVSIKVDDGFKSIVELGWAKCSISPKIILMVGDFADMILSVRGTNLIATVHDRLAQRFKASGEIRILACPLPLGPVQQHLYWHSKNDNDIVQSFMRDIILTAGRLTP